MTSSSVVIVIINHKEILDTYETISLKQCVKILGSHPIWMVVPDNLQTSKIEEEYKSVNILRVKNEFLQTYRAFNRFKINPFLYSHFKNFEYLLFYELDAFVFEDRLDFWCSLGYDFIGAPWILPTEQGMTFSGVGNGGLSLRKTASHLRVLKTFQKMNTISQSLSWYKQFNIQGKIIFFPRLIGKLTGVGYNTYWIFNTYDGNEDEFWSSMGELFNWFKIPHYSLAMKFSFEEYPQELYSMNDERLPFGTHAWYKAGRLDFWKTRIEQHGYLINENH